MWTNVTFTFGRPCLPFTLILSLVFIIIIFFMKEKEKKESKFIYVSRLVVVEC